MAKSCGICFILALLFLTSFDGIEMATETQICTQSWTCYGGALCFDGCKEQFNGVGECGNDPEGRNVCICTFKCRENASRN
ncbi:hypothetical protein LINGRAHAP2_LOCUS13198 [Linum grandiflorum]